MYYNYPEIEPISNYWQFLAHQDRQVLKSQLLGEQSNAQHDEYDSLHDLDSQ